MATDTETRSRRAKSNVDPRQLGLFESASTPHPSPPARTPAPAPPPPANSPRAVAPPAPTSVKARRQFRRTPAVRTVVVEDLPAYPNELIKMVDTQIKTIPTDRVLLTYREIQDYFGVSRATVIRRFKDGVVPGIRIADGRVLDDGPVRRLDRTQVRWLLLAVRHARA